MRALELEIYGSGLGGKVSLCYASQINYDIRVGFSRLLPLASKDRLKSVLGTLSQRRAEKVATLTPFLNEETTKGGT